MRAHGQFMIVCLMRLLLALYIVLLPAHAWNEAPALAAQVASGELPPVAGRLPRQPAVVEPVNAIGVYGGTWRRLARNITDIGLNNRFGYEPLVRWGRDGRTIEPNVAASWDISDDGRTYALTLREGMRWSDGQPFTSADLIFYYEDVLLNDELTPVVPAWLHLGGETVVMDAPDAYTIRFKFPEPYGIFLEMLAYRSTELLYPSHYLKQYHPSYRPLDDLEAQAHAIGLDFWFQLFLRQYDINDNPDMPTIKAWKISVPLPARRVRAERNPYYWKVDPEGNQLPYIDSIAWIITPDAEVGNFKAMTGSVDMQARFMDAGNYPLFMENRHKAGYHVLRDYDPVSTVVYINQFSKDPVLRPLLQDRRFRIALSLAVNREELIDLIYSGMASPSRGVISKFDPYFEPEYNEKYIEYDPARANALLDELGMKRDAISGLRRMPDGSRFAQILHAHPSEVGTPAEQWQLVADYWREVGLDFNVKIDSPSLSVLQVSNGNSDFWGYATAGMHWIVDPQWYIPWVSASYFAPLHGRYYDSRGKAGVAPPPEIARLHDWYAELRSVVNDDERRLALGRNILRQWTEECYTIGIVHQEQVTIVSNRFKNVPDHIIHSFRLMTPGYIGIEQFYIDEE